MAHGRRKYQMALPRRPCALSTPSSMGARAMFLVTRLPCRTNKPSTATFLSNAFKFTFAEEIAVALRHAGDHVELSVRDTGTGIPAHELLYLFERFLRVRGAQARPQRLSRAPTFWQDEKATRAQRCH
jgi:hypothetical protein